MVQVDTRRKRGFTTREAGEYIGRSASWLRKKRLRGDNDPEDPGPRYVKTPSGAAIYLIEDLDSYLDALVASGGSRPECGAAAQMGERSKLGRTRRGAHLRRQSDETRS